VDLSARRRVPSFTVLLERGVEGLHIAVGTEGSFGDGEGRGQLVAPPPLAAQLQAGTGPVERVAVRGGVGTRDEYLRAWRVEGESPPVAVVGVDRDADVLPVELETFSASPSLVEYAYESPWLM